MPIPNHLPSILFIALLALHMAGARAGTMSCHAANNPDCAPGFPVEFSGGTIPSDIGVVMFSSPAVARLGLVEDAMMDIVVGTRTGYVVAYHGDGTFLWAHRTGTIAVQGKPAIADIDGDGTPEIVVGAGNPGTSGGGIHVLNANGTPRCSFTALDASPLSGGMYSSPAVGRLDPSRPHEMQIVVGSFDAHVRALRPDCSLWWSKGVPDDVIDTIWSSQALYDLDGGGLDVIIGIDSGQGTLPNGLRVGGQLRAFHGSGVGEVAGFPRRLDEVIYSSPAIGALSGQGQVSIVVGNGRCYDLASCAPGSPQAVIEALYAWSPNGANVAGWPYAMPSQSTRTSSPALADLDGDGALESIISTLEKTPDPATNDKNGFMHVVRSSGAVYPGWPVRPRTASTCSQDVNWGPAFASPIAVDLDGDSFPEILAPIALQVSVWNRDGVQLSYDHADACANPDPDVLQLRANSGIYSTPTAADIDGDGKIEVVVGGGSTPGGSIGALYAWTFPDSVASPQNMPWPQFRHDVRNTGVHVGDVIFVDGFD